MQDADEASKPWPRRECLPSQNDIDAFQANLFQALQELKGEGVIPWGPASWLWLEQEIPVICCDGTPQGLLRVRGYSRDAVCAEEETCIVAFLYSIEPKTRAPSAPAVLHRAIFCILVTGVRTLPPQLVQLTLLASALLTRSNPQAHRLPFARQR